MLNYIIHRKGNECKFKNSWDFTFFIWIKNHFLYLTESMNVTYYTVSINSPKPIQKKYKFPIPEPKWNSIKESNNTPEPTTSSLIEIRYTPPQSSSPKIQLCHGNTHSARRRVDEPTTAHSNLLLFHDGLLNYPCCVFHPLIAKAEVLMTWLGPKKWLMRNLKLLMNHGWKLNRIHRVFLQL